MLTLSDKVCLSCMALLTGAALVAAAPASAQDFPNTGVRLVVPAPVDGYTLLVAPDSTFTANPALFSKLSYDPQMFTPIVVSCRASPVLVVNASVKAD